MNYVAVEPAGLSPAEFVILAIFLVLVVAAGWTFYRKWSGREKSDISGLHFTRRR